MKKYKHYYSIEGECEERDLDFSIKFNHPGGRFKYVYTTEVKDSKPLVESLKEMFKPENTNIS